MQCIPMDPASGGIRRCCRERPGSGRLFSKGRQSVLNIFDVNALSVGNISQGNIAAFFFLLLRQIDHHAKGIAAFGGYFHGLSPFGKFFYLILNQSEFSVKKFLRIFDTGFSNIGATHSGCRQNEQRKSGGFKALVFCHPLWENRCRIFCMLSAG